MNKLGMTLADTMAPVTKVQFNKWHSEGALLFYAAGMGDLNITLSRLNDYGHDYVAEARNVGVSRLDKGDKAYMFSNGVQEFILIVNDMQQSEYNRNYLKDTGRQHITVYLTATEV